MPLNRRHFVSTAVAAGAAGIPLRPGGPRTGPAVSPGSPRATAATARVAPAPGGLYTPNAAPLAPTAFLRLPPGAVTARGWLAGQLRLQLDGLCGHYPETSHYLDFATSGWVHPAGEGWDEVP
ncbi:MAG TPA: hypothetical protein VGL02_28835, partial [Streptomyces sp.]